MPENVFATVLMSADIDHLADQVMEALGIPVFFRGMARGLITKPLETILKFVPADLVQVLISAIDGLTPSELQVAVDTITAEVVQFSHILPDAVELPMYRAIVEALLSYAIQGKALTLTRGDA